MDKNGNYDDLHLQAIFDLQYTKGRKSNPADNHGIDLLAKIDGNVNDPSKLLVVQALRTGVVREKTLTAFIKNALGRDDKAIVWATPDRPALCAEVSGTRSTERPAPINQLRQHLRGCSKVRNI